ncbi:O-linked N-acetylglucosamine transferase, SPINDLY family protein [Scytonema sp. NUACC26]|uniref:O-linked N-acetylglucosamine transferase, SPINDLY family protein n=1 Tax=Scytonema sp. NUACC26 TaxID=3140176 RepID=UPI0038B3EF83
MNQASLTILPTKLQQQAYDLLIQGNYFQAISIYEQAIEIDSEPQLHYWYLGLVLFLQGQETEAQTTWFMGMLEGEPQQVEKWNQELIQVLQLEADRREELEEEEVAWKIRQQIKEISPNHINNLLHLVKLAIKLETYTGDEFTELGLLEVLKSKSFFILDLKLLMQVLNNVLRDAPLHWNVIEFVRICVEHIQFDRQEFLDILLPAAVEIAYSKKQSKIAARLGEIYFDLDPENAEFLLNLSGFYQNAGEYNKGIETAKTAYSYLKDWADLVFANRQVMRALMTAGGHWQEAYDINARQEKLLRLLINEKSTSLTDIHISRLYNSNFFAPYLEDRPRKHRQIQNQLLELCQKNTEILVGDLIAQYRQGHLKRRAFASSSTKPLKIGYLSHCLRSHSVGWLARWLFDYHDREKFQIYAYCLFTKPIFDPLHEWYIEQVSKLYNSNNVFDIANQIYQDEIDILIDLDSITLDLSCHVMALKPAPIQITWLGWDASSIPTVDYYIADPYVLPESAQEYYKEKIWRLPQTYIAVDGFEVGVPTLRREHLNIPNDAIVYLCAQRGFKRHPETTRLQLRIVKEVSNSYFLIKGTADEESNKNFFKKLAEEEELDFSRLRFLPDVPSETAHRANLSVADIVLDTYPYNGATTTLETLWMGIPLVTRVGEQFAARNSYTMMINAGITEGIAWTDREYIEWGVRLGKDSVLREQISWKLRQSRKTAPLWNSQQFTREMESAYEQMWQRYVKGEQ